MSKEVKERVQNLQKELQELSNARSCVYSAIQEIKKSCKHTEVTTLVDTTPETYESENYKVTRTTRTCDHCGALLMDEYRTEWVSNGEGL